VEQEIHHQLVLHKDSQEEIVLQQMMETLEEVEQHQQVQVIQVVHQEELVDLEEQDQM
jgi:hypothetical protein